MNFAFTSNADAVNTLILGKDVMTWLIYTIIFFVFTSLAFIATWAIGFIRDRRNGKESKEPWQ